MVDQEGVSLLSIAADWASVGVGVASVVIAASAVWIALKQARSSDRHNRLSVKPMMHSHVHAHDGMELVVRVMNNGMGPAVIRSVKFGLRDGDELLDWDAWVFREFVDHTLGFGVATVLADDPDWHEFEYPYAMKAGDSLNLMVMRSGSRDVADMDELRDKIRESLVMVIDYESIYGERYVMREPKGGNVNLAVSPK